MRRWTLILCLALIATFLISLTGCLPAPDPSDPTTEPTTLTNIPDPSGDPIDLTTTPTEPTPEIPDVQLFSSTIFVTHIYSYDGRLESPTPAELELTITRSADGQETVSMNMSHIDDMFYRELNYQDPDNSFAAQSLDPERPIYYIDAQVRSTDRHYLDVVQFIIDLDSKQILFRSKMVPTFAYTVASADPAANPYDILDALLPHLQKQFPAWTEDPMYPIPERAEQHFYYELTGTWLDAEGNPLEQMDFRLVGNLTPDGGFNDDVERNLLFLWPEGFGYENAEPVSEGITLTVQEDGPNYHGVGLLRDTKTDEMNTFSFNIFPEDEIVILEMDSKYLVSSTRSDLDAVATLSAYMDRLQPYIVQAVNWEMTAYMLQADGTLIDTDTMTITGYIREYSEIYNQLVLDIAFPADFRFDCGASPGPYGNYAAHILTDDPHDLIWNDLAYDSITQDFTHPKMLINSDKGYFLGVFDAEDTRYLAACTDPNVTADQILAHFWDYLEHNGYTD